LLFEWYPIEDGRVVYVIGVSIIKILVVPKKKIILVEEVVKNVSTIQILIQDFIICYFYCQKTAFVCEFQHTSLWKLMIFSRFHTLCGHVLNSPLNKNLKGRISYLLEKVDFLDPKILLHPLGRGKKKLQL
jgi:hypothetical protein